jgi:hypothetical protein
MKNFRPISCVICLKKLKLQGPSMSPSSWPYVAIRLKSGWYSSVGIATDYGLDGWFSIPGSGEIFLYSSASIPDLGSTHYLYHGYLGRRMKLNTHFHLVPRSIMVQLYRHSPIRLHDLLLN